MMSRKKLDESIDLKKEITEMVNKINQVDIECHQVDTKIKSEQLKLKTCSDETKSYFDLLIRGKFPSCLFIYLFVSLNINLNI